LSVGDIARLSDVYLQKPFSCEALMQIIEDARYSSDAAAFKVQRPPNVMSHAGDQSTGRSHVSYAGAYR
jgi:hypothetical protein